MKRVAAWTVLSLLVVSGTSFAQTFTYELEGEPVFSINLPVGWTILTESDEDLLERPAGIPPMPLLVSARPKTGLLWFGTWVRRGLETFEEAEEYLNSLVGHLFHDVVTDYIQEGIHHEMTFRYYEGTAVKTTTGPQLKKDEKVDYYVAFFKPSGDLMGVAIYVGVPNATERYGETLKAAMSTIRPVKASP
jgi:hypothetical protein